MKNKFVLTSIITAIIFAYFIIGELGFNNVFPWGWLNATVKVVWLLSFVALIANNVYNNID